MANNYFQFKQFRVNQDKAAMKVGTDGVLLGAWAKLQKATRILDIGTGTGLIALMAAQRNPDAEIVAIDINEDACQQALENFQDTPWSKRLSVVHTSLEMFVQLNAQNFDYIICNPPFFNNSLKSDNQARNMARHTDSLSYNDLCFCSKQLLTESGTLGVVIPYVSENQFIDIAKCNGFYLSGTLHVKGDINKEVVRSLFEFSQAEHINHDVDIMVIEEGKRHAYSDKYRLLTKDFYLAF